MPNCFLASLSAWLCNTEVATCDLPLMKVRAWHEPAHSLLSCGCVHQHAAHGPGVNTWATAGILAEKVLPAPCRWETPDGSIFSVADGRRLAQEPVRLPTAFEAARQRKIDRATMETPLVRLRCAQSATCICISQNLRFD